MLFEILVLSLSLSAQKAPQAETQSPTAIDETRLEACLAEAQQAESCIGVVSNACQEDPGGYTTYGMMEWAHRETELWDQRLNAAYFALRDRLQAREQLQRRERLLDAQRAWLAFREAECSQQSLAYEGGTLMGVIANSCFNDFTARRALDLEAQLAELDM